MNANIPERSQNASKQQQNRKSCAGAVLCFIACGDIAQQAFIKCHILKLKWQTHASLTYLFYTSKPTLFLISPSIIYGYKKLSPYLCVNCVIPINLSLSLPINDSLSNLPIYIYSVKKSIKINT